MQYNTRFHTGPQGSCRSLLDLRRFHAYAGCARRRGFVACGTRRGLVILLGAQLENPCLSHPCEAPLHSAHCLGVSPVQVQRDSAIAVPYYTMRLTATAGPLYQP